MLSKRPVLIAIVLTLLALVESTIAPWAPLILLYAALCIIIPVASESCRFGSFKKAFSGRWHILIICLVLMTAWDQLWMRLFSSLGNAWPVFMEAAKARLNADELSAKITFVFFLLIWAPIGEEFFYRGYLQGNLRKKIPFMKALLIASFFFAIRHGLHLLFLYPDIPWMASLMWVALAFGWGIVLGWLYEKSSSLYLPVAAHFLANLISLILG